MSFIRRSEPKAKIAIRPLVIVSSILLYLGTLLLPLWFLPFTRDVVNLPKQLLIEGIVLVSLFLWFLRMTLAKQISIRRTVLDIPLGLLLIFTFISSIISVMPGASWLGNPANFVVHAATLVAWILWFWIFVQDVHSIRRWDNLLQVFLLSGALAGALFLIPQLHISWLDRFTGINVVSGVHSVFGMYIAIIGTVGLGVVLSKRSTWARQIIPAIAVLVSLAVLIRLGFTISWVVFAVGLGFLLIVGSTMLADTRLWALSATFFFFLISLLCIFFGTPNFAKRSLPLEISLGSEPSWSIAKATVLSSPKTFLFGSGPGTFLYDFSKHRPPLLNANNIAWSIRFSQPYSTPVAILAEFGVGGLVLFLFVVLIQLGTIFGAWLKNRPSALHDLPSVASYRQVEDVPDSLPFEVFIVIAAWFATTVGMAISFYDMTMWWVWWWLLGASLVALSRAVPGIIREKKLLLPMSPQYALALSFGVVLVFTTMIIVSVHQTKIYLAEVAYTKAVATGNIDEQQLQLATALNYRPNYSPYELTVATLYLQKAGTEAQKSSPDTNAVAGDIAQAVNFARTAADQDSQKVETWQTLAIMYLNARAFVPEANQWARDALKKAIDLEPTNPLLYVQLGGVEDADSHWTESEKAYRQARDLKPDYLAAVAGLSQALEHQNKLDEAIAVYQPVFNSIQNNGEMLFNLGRLFYNRRGDGDNGRAEQVWLQAVAVAPNYSNALFSLGLLYERVGQRSRALEYYNRVSELNPNNQEVLKKIRSLSL